MIDVDLLDNGTRHPNLAQMKMSAFCKSRGHDVELIYTDNQLDTLHDYDLLLVSKVFTFTKVEPRFQKLLPSNKEELVQLNGCIREAVLRYEQKKPQETVVLIGGTGFFENGGINLHTDVEHSMPDYTLYLDYVNAKIDQGRSKTYFDDYLNYSIGFTTRGCFRQCHFCVNKKYKKAFRHAKVTEFLDKDRPMIYLWDDNIFALFDGWQEIFDELDATGKPFQFRQGLDIRLLKEEHAKRLMSSKYHGDIIFAFDHVDQAELIERKLKLWRTYCSKTTKLYVLCAFDSWDYEVVSDSPLMEKRHYFLERMNDVQTQDERDQLDILGIFERIEILMRYGCLPYIMRYEKYKDSKYKGVYTELARWVNQPQFFKKKSFRQFCEANRDYNKTELCASYQALVLFEKDRPDIAKQYFDMRFDEMNRCETISSYSHLDTIPCFVCEPLGCTWDKIMTGESTDESAIREYYSGKLDYLCLITKKHPQCSCSIDACVDHFLDILSRNSIDKIIGIIDQIDTREVTPSEVPQFSSFEDAIGIGLKLLSKRTYNYIEFGSEFPNRTSNTEISKQKYGENQGKLLSQLDLAVIDSTKHPYEITISPFGKKLQNDTELLTELLPKLILKIPLIQAIIKDSRANIVDLDECLSSVLKLSTVKRRRSNIISLLKILQNTDSTVIWARFKNIKEIDF